MKFITYAIRIAYALFFFSYFTGTYYSPQYENIIFGISMFCLFLGIISVFYLILINFIVYIPPKEEKEIKAREELHKTFQNDAQPYSFWTIMMLIYILGLFYIGWIYIPIIMTINTFTICMLKEFALKSMNIINETN